MKNVLILLIVVGVLLMGTFAVAEEASCETTYSLEGEYGDPQGGPAPCGGGDGAGPGGLPG